MKNRLFLFTLYFLLTMLFTYPLIRNFSSGIYGYPGDPLGSINSFWWKKNALLSGKTLSFFPNFNYPFGIVEPYFKEILASLPAEILTIFTNEIFAYNFFVFFSFPLAGLTMFLLAKHLTKNSWAAFVAGLIYTFCPYHLWQSYSHFSLSQIQWLPLFVLALIKLDEKKSFKNILFLVGAFSLVFWTSFYYGYFALLFAVFWIVVKSILCHLSRKKTYLSLSRIKTYGMTFFLAIVLSFPILLPALWQKLKDPYHLRSPLYEFKDLKIADYAAFTARPWDFFLPATDHFLLGGIVKKIYFNIRQFGEQSSGLNYIFKDAGRAEGTLYLGFIPLLLAITAFVAKSSTRRVENKNPTGYVTVFMLLAIIFFFSSLLPFAGTNHLKIIFPSYFLVQIFPMFRVLARLGIIVTLCISVLAGIGMSKILVKFISQTEKLLATTLISTIILIEFLNVPPWRFTNLNFQPEAYDWLSQQSSEFTIAEYPRGYDTNFSAFFQRIHGKKVLSADLIGKDDFLNPNLSQKLKVCQVKYILFHKRLPFQEENPTNPSQAQYYQETPEVTDKNIVLIKSFPDTEIYEIR